MSAHYHTDLLFPEGPVRERPTLLRVRGAVSALLSRGDSFGASLEIREKLLLENSLLALLKLEVR